MRTRTMLLIAVLAGCGDTKPEKSGTAPVATAPVEVAKAKEPAKPDVATAPLAADVTVREFAEDYAENEIAADAKYRGKVIRVAGIAEGVARDDLGQPFVGLLAPNRKLVKAIFASEAGLAAVKKDEVIEMRCRGEHLAKPELVDCVLVPPEPSAAIPMPASATIKVDMSDGVQAKDVQQRLGEAAADIWNYCRAAKVDGDEFQDVWHTAAEVSIGRNKANNDRSNLTFIVKATFDERRHSVHHGAVAAYEVDSKLSKIRPLDAEAQRLCGLKSLEWSTIAWKKP